MDQKSRHHPHRANFYINVPNKDCLEFFNSLEGTLSVLDFGGSSGVHYRGIVENKSLSIPIEKWTVVEVPSAYEDSAEFFDYDETLKFYDDLSNVVGDYNVGLFISSTAYLDDDELMEVFKYMVSINHIQYIVLAHNDWGPIPYPDNGPTWINRLYNDFMENVSSKFDVEILVNKNIPMESTDKNPLCDDALVLRISDKKLMNQISRGDPHPLRTALELIDKCHPFFISFLDTLKEDLSVLDFGGSGGWLYNSIIHHKLLSRPIKKWTVVEVPSIYEACKDLNIEGLDFYDNLSDVVGQYNVAVFKSSSAMLRDRELKQVLRYMVDVNHIKYLVIMHNNWGPVDYHNHPPWFWKNRTYDDFIKKILKGIPHSLIYKDKIPMKPEDPDPLCHDILILKIGR